MPRGVGNEPRPFSVHKEKKSETMYIYSTKLQTMTCTSGPVYKYEQVTTMDKEWLRERERAVEQRLFEG
jgi:hypothetical protein